MARPPFSRDELMALYRSVVDEDFWRSLAKDPDSELVVEQAAEQFARVSESVSKSFESFFLVPWSGQNYPPASGGSRAVVELSVSRSPLALATELTLDAVAAEEEVVFPGESGGVPAGSGRLYRPLLPVVFPPGLAEGAALFVADRPGAGWNLPLPDSIVRLPSFSAAGEGASIVVSPAGSSIAILAGTDPVPLEAAGQYVEITQGASLGRRKRVLKVDPPDDAAPNAGVLWLAPVGSVTITNLVGSFEPGESVTASPSGAELVVLAATSGLLVVEALVSLAEVAAGDALLGATSGATADVSSVDDSPLLPPETGTVGWRLLSWAELGVSVTNAASPSGGRAATLDHIGAERAMGRSPGEGDEPYRARLHRLPDVVAPNAVLRAANRVLAPLGLEACLREPGDLATFPGFFDDLPEQFGASYDDLDFDAFPEFRWNLELDLVEHTRFFVVSVPPIYEGDFSSYDDAVGLPNYDDVALGSYDDGFPVETATILRRVWDAVDAVRAPGVTFDLVVESGACDLAYSPP